MNEWKNLPNSWNVDINRVEPIIEPFNQDHHLLLIYLTQPFKLLLVREHIKGGVNIFFFFNYLFGLCSNLFYLSTKLNKNLKWPMRSNAGQAQMNHQLIYFYARIFINLFQNLYLFKTGWGYIWLKAINLNFWHENINFLKYMYYVYITVFQQL